MHMICDHVDIAISFRRYIRLLAGNIIIALAKIMYIILQQNYVYYFAVHIHNS